MLNKWAEKRKHRAHEGSLFWRFVAALLRSPVGHRDRHVRKRVFRKRHLRWWLVYGMVRTGTSYMVDLIATQACLKVSDWWLVDLLKPAALAPQVTYDRARALRNISLNIIDNAHRGSGTTLDVAFKEAGMTVEEYRALVEMWGKPERVIFCYRDPSGFIASAEKKFMAPGLYDLETLQKDYLEMFSIYREIGGDPFEYHSQLTLDDYIRFLSPLPVRSQDCEPFVYRGERKDNYTNETMWATYRLFRDQHVIASKK